MPNELDYLADGDVLAVELQRPAVRVLYRRNSRHNSFLLTERCNHYCLMCSQPPKDINDDWIVDELFQAMPLISQERLGLHRFVIRHLLGDASCDCARHA